MTDDVTPEITEEQAYLTEDGGTIIVQGEQFHREGTQLQRLALELHTNSVDHGFWPMVDTTYYPDAKRHFETRNFGEMLALMHSELSEALEEDRDGKPLVYFGPTGKPEGAAIELVDGAIRIFDALGSMLDNEEQVIKGEGGTPYTIDDLFRLKASFNAGREALHGKAY